jgi:hypothetical protein
LQLKPTVPVLEGQIPHDADKVLLEKCTLVLKQLLSRAHSSTLVFSVESLKRDALSKVSSETFGGAVAFLGVR